MNRPQKFGRYLLIDRISTGGMAAVFLAKISGAMGFQKVLAIKRILPSISEDEDFITMFIDEAKISASLAHSNIGQVFEFGQVSGQYYIAMEYIPGKDLRTIQKHLADDSRKMEVPIVLHLVSRLCQGLDYAHRQKDAEGKSMCIVHRDVSPPNVIVSYDGGVKLIDFGIAKAASRATKTRTGRLKGKFAYMAPEQVQGQEIDQRADVFSVGILLHELLTNQRLFLGPNQVATMNMVRKAEVAPPSAVNPEVPPEIDRIVLKALARDKEERYCWCTELRADIERFIARSGVIFEAHQLSTWMKEEFVQDVDKEQKLQERIDTLQMADAEGDAITAEEKFSKPSLHPPRIFVKNPDWDAAGGKDESPADEEPPAGDERSLDGTAPEGELPHFEDSNGADTPLELLPEVMSEEIALPRAAADSEEPLSLEEDRGAEEATLVKVPSFVEVSGDGLPSKTTDRNETGDTDQAEATGLGVDQGPERQRQGSTPAPEVLVPAAEQWGGDEGPTIPIRKKHAPTPTPSNILPPPPPLPPASVQFSPEEAETVDLSEQAKTNPRASSTISREIEPPEEPLFQERALLESLAGRSISPGEDRVGEVVGGALEIDSVPDYQVPDVDPIAPVDLRGMGDYQADLISQPPPVKQPLPAKVFNPTIQTARQRSISYPQGRFSSTQLKAIAAGVTLLIGSLVLLMSYLIKEQVPGDSAPKFNTGTIIVTTRPPAVCSVSIGGTPKGVIKPGTPFSLSGISTGRYQIALECVGHQPYTTFVDVEHAQVSFVEGVLKK